ncbi:MAG: group 1 truncated hemoglobin [Pseudolysinimonas sp.]
MTSRSWDVTGQGVDAKSIRKAVDLFYTRVLADPLLADMFGAADLPVLRAHQRLFLLQALGAPALYSGRDLKIAHSDLAINDAAFDRTIAHLIASLREVGVAPDVVDRAAVDIEALRALIVTVL